MKLALFDLDHTLIPLDSDHSWGVFTTSLGWNDPIDFTLRNDDFYADYKAGTLDIREYIRFSTAAMRTHGAIESEVAHADFMRDVIAPAIKPQALNLVAGHQDAGDQVLIITATNEFVTRPIAKAFGVDELLAVELEREDTVGGSWFTGEIKGVPSFREGKVTRLEAWLASRQLRLADVESTFYTDSINDLSLMENVTHPVATNPDERLRAIAVQRGWRILDLF
ncbi:HAD family phosphatase [Rhodoferax sp. PAMC 29310]|uniref:histidinol-phosphatase n=1 Tax=Rhodoferax sp. PAMC 29310 TaxID=2822760 RepID=UPI001B325D54|nr:HAD family hydrolase [Rhodoferax sp. PAMC 29310]